MERERSSFAKRTADAFNAADVAVVIPSYNAERWVVRAIESALAQGAGQVIVVDDGSTDRTLDKATAFGDRVSCLTGPNRGANHARNKGLSRVDRPYVVFLDADDFFDGPMLHDSVVEAARHDADIVLAPMRIERADGESSVRDHLLGAVDPEVLLGDWVRGHFINPSATLWRTGFIRRLGWDENIYSNQDGDTMYRALLLYPRVRAHRGGCGVYWRQNTGSISHSESHRALESRLTVMSRLLDAVQGTPFQCHSSLIDREMYRIARRSFANGHADIGRSALERRRCNGYRSHHGPWRHRLACSILGLELKTRLRER